MFEMFISQRKQNKFMNSTFEKRVKMTKLEKDVKLAVTRSEDERANREGKGSRVFGAFKKAIRPRASGEFVISNPKLKSGTSPMIAKAKNAE